MSTKAVLISLLEGTFILLIYFLLNFGFFELSPLPQESYFRPVLALELLKHNYLLLIGLTIPILRLFRKYKTVTWDAFQHGKIVRYLVFFTALILAYAFSTYEYNLYFNQPHYLDRFFLVVLAFLTLYTPFVTPFFVVLLLAILAQFTYPVFQSGLIGGYSFTDKRTLIDTLILFCAFLWVATIRKQNLKNYFFLAFCLHGIHYFASGIGKLQINWLSHEKIYNLFISSYINGWLSGVDSDRIFQIADWIKTLNAPILITSILLELSPLLLFSHRLAPLIILTGLNLFHLGVFAASGFLFWKWMLFNVAFLVVLNLFNPRERASLFKPPYVVVSTVLILLSPVFFSHVTFKPIQDAKPPELAWFDTRLNTFYEIEAIGESGKVYEVSRNFMSPYDFIFVQNRFHYLLDQDMLVRTYGQTLDLKVEQALDEISLSQNEKRALRQITRAVRRLEAKEGKNYFKEKRSRLFEEFITTYFQNLNNRMSKTIPINAIAAPHHHWTFARGDNLYELQEPVKTIQIRFMKTFVDHHKIYRFEDRIIRRFNIMTD